MYTVLQAVTIVLVFVCKFLNFFGRLFLNTMKYRMLYADTFVSVIIYIFLRSFKCYDLVNFISLFDHTRLFRKYAH